RSSRATRRRDGRAPPTSPRAGRPGSVRAGRRSTPPGRRRARPAPTPHLWTSACARLLLDPSAALHDDSGMMARLLYHNGPVILMLCLVVMAASAEGLSDVLPVVARPARAPRPLRADVRIERDGAPPVDAVLLERGRRRYLETRTGTRALLSPGKVVVARDGRPARAAPGPALDGTDVLLEDLEPFGVGALAIPQVSDEGPTGMGVTGAP